MVDHSISNRVIHWIDFYPVDNAIQRLNNRGLVAKLKVNHRGSSNRLWSNLIAIRVDTQLKNGFGVQLCIDPDCYQVGPQTIAATSEIDPTFSNQEIEWSTKQRGSIILYGLLVKLDETD